tara:strand:+ start:158 stop:463 length:306 start_codon:yes stop_codon:yes gene_type:complete
LGQEDASPVVASVSIDDPVVVRKNYDLQAGSYEATCEIPANLHGSTKSYVSVHLEYPGVEHHVLDKIVSFETRFSPYNDEFSATYENVFLRPQFEWRIEQK